MLQEKKKSRSVRLDSGGGNCKPFSSDIVAQLKVWCAGMAGVGTTDMVIWSSWQAGEGQLCIAAVEYYLIN